MLSSITRLILIEFTLRNIKTRLFYPITSKDSFVILLIFTANAVKYICSFIATPPSNPLCAIRGIPLIPILFLSLLYIVPALDIFASFRTKYIIVVFILKLDSYLEEHLSGNISVEELCGEFHMGRIRLYDTASNYLGCGLVESIREQRIMHAQKLLETDLRRFCTAVSK